jgi:hypothetical protein
MHSINKRPYFGNEIWNYTIFKMGALDRIGSAGLGTAQPGSDQANVRELLQNLSVPESVVS